jgi:hypothetical protein
LVRAKSNEFAQNTAEGRKFLEGWYDLPTNRKITKLTDLKVEYDPESLEVQYSNVDERASPRVYAAEKRAAQEAGVVNGLLGIWNTLRTLIATYESMPNCPLWGMMAWYLNQFEVEPFVQEPRGNIKITTEDWLVTTRIATLTNYMTWWCDFGTHGRYPVEGLIEVAQFMFFAPMARTLDLKGTSAIFNQVGGASAHGLELIWPNADMTHPYFAPINPIYDDTDVYMSLLPEFNEELEKLESFGLTKMAARRRGTIGAKAGPDLNFLLGVDRFIEAGTGFYRGHPTRKLIDGMRKASSREHPSNPALLAKLYSMDYEFYSVLSVPTREEWQRAVFNELTTRSAGITSDDRAKVEVMVGGRMFQITISSKILHYLVDNGFKDFDIRNDNAKQGTDSKDPGRIAKRNVPARGDRAVMMTGPNRAASSSAFRKALQRFQADTLYNGEPLTTFTGVSGRELSDHAAWFRAMSGMFRMILLALDYSAFDTTQGRPLTQAQARAADEALKHRPEANVPITEDGWTYRMIVVNYFETASQLKWKLPDYVANRAYVFTSVYTASGEGDTIHRNNKVNAAAMDVMIEQVFKDPDLLPYFGLPVNIKIQGDDQQCTLNITDAFMRLTLRERADKLIHLRLRITEVSALNGLDINTTKSVLSMTSFEFLKKAGKNGMAIARPTQLQLNASERNSNAEDTIELFRARIDFRREMVFRGYSSMAAHLGVLFEWAVRSPIKAPRRPTIYIPIELLFASPTAGGVGFDAWNLTQPNMTTVMDNTRYDPIFQDRLNKCRMAYERSQVPEVDSAIDELISTRMTGALEHLQRIEDRNRVEGSLLAAEVLREQYGYNDRLTYTKRYRAQIEATIKENPSWRTLRVYQKYEKWLSFVNIYNEIAHSPSTMFLRDWTWRLGDVVSDVVDPFMPVDPYLSKWMQQIGTGAAETATMEDVDTLLAAVVNDPDFPSAIPGNSTEALAREMLDNGLTSQTAIVNFLVSRGGDHAKSMKVASVLANKSAVLLHLQRSTKYSTASDGFTDRSMTRMADLANYQGPNKLREAGTLIGGQVCLSRNLMELRRHVEIRPTPTMVAKLGKVEGLNNANVLHYLSLSLSSLTSIGGTDVSNDM